MKNSKRIHKVTIKRMFDDSPDTSWLGEYSNRAESDYAIDRKHDTDCISQAFNHPTAEGSDHLQNAIEYLENEYQRMADAHEALGSEFDRYRESTVSAIQTLEELRDAECNCSNGALDRGEYRYFNGPIDNYKGLPADEILKYVLQDYARMESLQRGDFCFLGIRAEAEYSVGLIHGDSRLMQEMSSGGLWGIESDSDRSHLQEIENEQLDELRAHLAAIGFSQRAITAAFRTVEREEN